MARLIHKTTEQVLAQDVIPARKLYPRLMGLMGKKDFPHQSALWLVPCRSIHTFFMKFPIDVIFVNRALRITYIRKNILPYRTAHPPLHLLFKTFSVFEFKTPANGIHKLQTGDQLYVGN